MRWKFGSSSPGAATKRLPGPSTDADPARSSTTWHIVAPVAARSLRAVSTHSGPTPAAPTPESEPRLDTSAPRTGPDVAHPAGSADARSITAGPPAERLGFVRLLRTGNGYRRLLTTRFALQWADGMFQAALGGAVLFNPERQADPLAVAAGLAVLLLPYSLIGPFAGALLDRWDRRGCSSWPACCGRPWSPAWPASWPPGWTGRRSTSGALLVAGVSRFTNAGLSVALPHCVPRRHLVEANTLAVTMGAGVAALGGATAIGLREIIGPDDAGSAITTLAAMVGLVLGAAVAAGFRPRPARARIGTGSAPPVAVRPRAGRRRPGHPGHAVGGRVVPGAGRAPAGLRHQHPAHPAAVPLLVRRRRSRPVRAGRGR